MKVEAESQKKIQTGIKLEMKNSGIQAKTSNNRVQESLTNRVQDRKDRILGIEDKIEGMNSSVKENVKSLKNIGIKQPRNPRHHEKTKSMKNRRKGERRNSSQRYRKYF